MARSSTQQTPGWERWAVGLLVCVAAVLLFTRLDDSYLWQDEAETAVLARNTLRYGYPRASDGVHQLSVPFAGHRPGEVWVFHQWLQFYLAAVSFALFGTTTWAARAPFALLGLGSILLTWVLARRLFEDRRIAVLTLLLLVTSIPFLLHMRQCRYYAPVVFFELCALLAYWSWFGGARGAAWKWLASLLLLFHSNWMAGITSAAAMVGHWACHGGRIRIAPRSFVSWMLAYLALCVPWMVYARVWEHSGGGLTTTAIRHNLEFYVKMVNGYVVPLGGLALAAVVQRLRGQQPRLQPFNPQATSLLWWMIGMTFLALLLGRQHFFRYLIGLVPLALLLLAWVLVRWYGDRPVVFAAIVALLLGTDLFHRPDHLLRWHLRSYPVDYLYELTHESQDSTKGIIAFLNTHAKPGETAKIRYSSAPLVFYTRLRIETDPEGFFKPTYPDWIIIQSDWIPPDFYERPYFASIVAQYERLDSPIPDYLWGSPPDPYLHLFRTPPGLPHVIFYHKRATHLPRRSESS